MMPTNILVPKPQDITFFPSLQFLTDYDDPQTKQVKKQILFLFLSKQLIFVSLIGYLNICAEKSARKRKKKLFLAFLNVEVCVWPE